MKLISCLACGDVRGLSGPGSWICCHCRRSHAHYLDNRLHAELEGAHGIMLGIANPSLDAAIAAELDDVAAGRRRALGRDVSAWVIPWASPRVRRLGPPLVLPPALGPALDAGDGR